MIKQYKRIFGYQPKEYTSLLKKTDNPEIETTEELDQAGIQL
jgi:hypothetical protein